MRFYRLMLVAFCGCLVVAGGDSQYERATLKGVGPIKVVVESIEPEVERVGLSALQVRTDVELRLRKAGIVVVDSGASIPFLYVSLNVLPIQEFYVIGYTVEFNQAVMLPRDPLPLSIMSATWNARPVVGLVGHGRMRSIRDQVLDMVDQFVNAYFSVNPTPKADN